MFFIDTHSHLYLEQFNSDIDNVIKNCNDAGVKKVLLPNIDINSLNPMISLQEKYPQILKLMAGLHPTSVNKDWENDLQTIMDKLLPYNPIAIGECGIDLYWDKTYKNEQEKAFIKQIEIAIKIDLPIVIHSRKSLDFILEIFKSINISGLRGVFHCYPGNIIQAEKIIALGFYLGIGGVVSYKNAEMAEVTKAIPLEYLLLETDSPFLPPQEHRGQRNESSYIPLIAKKIAEIKRIDIEEVAKATTNNALNLFNKLNYE